MGGLRLQLRWKKDNPRATTEGGFAEWMYANPTLRKRYDRTDRLQWTSGFRPIIEYNSTEQWTLRSDQNTEGLTLDDAFFRNTFPDAEAFVNSWVYASKWDPRTTSDWKVNTGFVTGIDRTYGPSYNDIYTTENPRRVDVVEVAIDIVPPGGALYIWGPMPFARLRPKE